MLRSLSWIWSAACCSSSYFTATVTSLPCLEMGHFVLQLLLLHYRCDFAPFLEMSHGVLQLLLLHCRRDFEPFS